MHGWETRMLLKHYLERGVSKSELSRRFGVSRRTIYEWIEAGDLDHPPMIPNPPRSGSCHVGITCCLQAHVTWDKAPCYATDCRCVQFRKRMPTAGADECFAGCPEHGRLQATWRLVMEWTVISLGLSYLGVSIAFMGLMSRMFRSQFEGISRRFETIDQRFETIDKRFDRVEDKIDDLASDHQSLARELSEFRGEMRGRLGDPQSVTS